MHARLLVRLGTLVVLLTTCIVATAQAAVGTAFTYQGQLKQDGVPVNDTADFEFRLWDEAGSGDPPTGGIQVGPTLTFDGQGGNPAPIALVNGLFTVQLDFGSNAFTGDARWLEVVVTYPSGSGVPTTLSPRQQLAATPYALYALSGPGSGSNWAVNGDDIYNTNSGDVGIGTTSPSYPLHVSSASSRSIFVENTNATGTRYGLWAESDSTTGRGVYGRATAATGTTIGIYGRSSSDSGQAVYGYASSSTGTTYGVHGETKSPDGYAGYFEGGRNYFEGYVGIGTTDPGRALDVNGQIRLRSGPVVSNAGIWLTDAADVEEWFVGKTNVLGKNQLGFHKDEWRMVVEDNGRVGIGTSTPSATLHVGDIGSYYWGSGDGWGDFSLNNGSVGFSIGVATGGTGTGDVYMWSTGGTERMILGSPTDGKTLTLDNGNVGIGTVNPSERLHVSGGNARVDGEVSLFNDAGQETVELRAAEGATDQSGQIVLRKADNTRTIEIDAEYGADGGGYISVIGGPNERALNVQGSGSGTNDATLRVRNTEFNQGMAAYMINNSTFATVHIENDGPGETLWLENEGGGHLIVARTPERWQFWVDGDGITNSRVLRIHGGADLSEGFDVRGLQADSEDKPAPFSGEAQSRIQDQEPIGTTPLPGMVVSIDPENPGKLAVSSESYDRKVAGIISGAGGVKPGMLMGQSDSEANGDYPVALTGRVYCLCDASSGAIGPGDLLTTSKIPGHAMKVTDYSRATGAILGKAMTSLQEGQGLVLVLVSLQ